MVGRDTLSHLSTEARDYNKSLREAHIDSADESKVLADVSEDHFALCLLLDVEEDAKFKAVIPLLALHDDIRRGWDACIEGKYRPLAVSSPTNAKDWFIVDDIAPAFFCPSSIAQGEEFPEPDTWPRLGATKALLDDSVCWANEQQYRHWVRSLMGGSGDSTRPSDNVEEESDSDEGLGDSYDDDESDSTGGGFVVRDSDDDAVLMVEDSDDFSDSDEGVIDVDSDRLRRPKRQKVIFLDSDSDEDEDPASRDNASESGKSEEDGSEHEGEEDESDAGEEGAASSVAEEEDDEDSDAE